MSSSKSDEYVQRALGIALVVEELGKFSKVAFRYPPSPSRDYSEKNNSNIGGKTVENDRDRLLEDNIFFTLSPAVMAKLFRTKPALCGQPMTLSVGGTLFCCRSVLLNQSHGANVVDDNASLHSKHSTQTGSATNTSSSLDRLVMFNIIVAVLPLSSATNSHLQTDSPGKHDKVRKEFRSQNYPAIRRIHLSLSRLCAVLEREERRCLYMSRQVSMLLEISRRADSSSKKSSINNDDNQEDDQWVQADTMDLMITAKPPAPVTVESGNSDVRDFRTAIPLHGNLASELAEIYHSMERNDVVFQISPALLLTGRGGIVYINLHIAVLIEATTQDVSNVKHLDLYVPFLRKYHTILFPHVSASELLRNFASTGSSSDGDLSQRRLEKLLLVCDPFKNLSEMALDAALPLTSIMESAMSLIEFGACISAPVITSSTRFACQNGAVKLMSSLAMEFSQQFSHVTPIFILVAALIGSQTSEKHMSTSTYVNFGDIIRFCRLAFDGIFSTEDENKTKETIPSTIRILTNRLVTSLSANKKSSGIGIDVDTNGGDISFQNVESLLISMTTWVRSHSIIVEMKDYLVASKSSKVDVEMKKTSPTTESKKSIDFRASPFAYEDIESIYKECISQKYLDGSISTQALSWRLGISSRRMEALRDWGVQEKKLQVVTRIPDDSDDWGAC